jgi:hypothetical protein
MSRWLTQCLTVVAMLASLLHGQCLLACSLRSPVQATAAPQVADGAHSCCPQPSNEKSQKSEKPCQPDSVVVNPASNDAQPATNMLLPIALPAQLGGLLAPPNAPTRLAPHLSLINSPVSLRSSISILRI